MSLRWSQHLRLLPVTIVVTILVWMYAEAQFSDSQEDLRVTLEFRSGTPTQAIEVSEPANHQYRISVTGTRNNVDEFRRQSLGTLVVTERQRAGLTFSVPETKESEIRLDSTALLNQMPRFRDRGITVVSADPPITVIALDQMETLTLPIRVRAGVALKQATLTPDRAVVRIPRGKLLEIGGVDAVQVWALPARDLNNAQPETDLQVPARLQVEYPGRNDERVTISPTQVTLQARTADQKAAALALDDIPVWVSGPSSMLARYQVVLEPRFVKIDLTGTPEALQRVRNLAATMPRGEASHGVRAFLDLDVADNANASLRPRSVRWALPEGLEAIGTPPVVQFRLVAVPGN